MITLTMEQVSFFYAQDDRNQMLTTNVWVRQVSSFINIFFKIEIAFIIRQKTKQLFSNFLLEST